MKTSLNREKVENILKKGKRYTHDSVTIVCGKKHTSETKKYAILIAKKVEKLSSGRNRLRRVAREAIKETETGLREFVILHNSKKKNEEDFKKAVRHLLQKI